MNIFAGSQTFLGKSFLPFLEKHSALFLENENDYYYHPQKLDSLFKEHNPDFYFNFFEYNEITDAEYWREHAYTINAVALKHIAELCQRHNTRLIHISSLYVFGDVSENPYSPDDAPQPKNVYGDSKFLGEQYILQSQCNNTIIRISDLFDNSLNFNVPYIKYIHNEFHTIHDYMISPMSYVECSRSIDDIINRSSQEVEHIASEDRVYSKDFIQYLIDENSNVDKTNAQVKTMSIEEFSSIASLSKHSSLLPTVKTSPWKDIFSGTLEK